MLQKGIATPSLIVLILILIIIGGVTYLMMSDNSEKIFTNYGKEKITEDQKTSPESQTSLANPASEYCAKLGGTIQIQTRGDGGQYGVCNFEDDQSCEEWALFRGNCPEGGIKTIGYDTPEEIYCALIGGKTIAAPNSTCTLPDGKICSNSDLYNGKCQ